MLRSLDMETDRERDSLNAERLLDSSIVGGVTVTVVSGIWIDGGSLFWIKTYLQQYFVILRLYYNVYEMFMTNLFLKLIFED